MIERLFGSKIVAELPVLLRYARTLTGDETAAEDLVQDALVSACVGRSSLRDERSTRSWLLSILHNRFIDQCRRRKIERERVRHMAEELEDHVCGSQEFAIRLRSLDEAFSTLPLDQRTVLHLVAVEGLSYGEVAATIGVPIGTVMSRLSRARARLRDMERLPTQNDSDGRRRLRVVGGQDETAR